MSRRARIEEVLRFLRVEDSAELLELLRKEGLFEQEELEPEEAEELRVATSLVRELGVNPAGGEGALHLRRRLLVRERRVTVLLREVIDRRDPREDS